MFARYVRFIAFGSVTLAVAGCRISSFSLSAYDDDHHYHGRSHVTRVSIDAGHICTHDCHDHYWNGSRVVVLVDSCLLASGIDRVASESRRVKANDELASLADIDENAGERARLADIVARAEIELDVVAR